DHREGEEHDDHRPAQRHQGRGFWGLAFSRHRLSLREGVWASGCVGSLGLRLDDSTFCGWTYLKKATKSALLSAAPGRPHPSLRFWSLSISHHFDKLLSAILGFSA